MKLINLFRKSNPIQDYSSSKHSGVYEKIARELNSSAQHVYDIAHGKSVDSYDDFVILDRLLKHGIVG